MCNLYTYKLSRDEIRGLLMETSLTGFAAIRTSTFNLKARGAAV
jgi:hypothetical protein